MNKNIEDRNFTRLLTKTQRNKSSSLRLDHGSRVAVIGGGPAGSLFSYFLLEMAERIDLKIHVDIYESRDFDVTGPAGCNMCGGVIYEFLVQSLAMEGINLPPSVVQRGIEYNMLHLDIGSTQIRTQRHEKRIATIFRGAGPRGFFESGSNGLDGYLMQVAIAKGARHIHRRANKVRYLTDTEAPSPMQKLIQIKAKGNAYQTYELLAVTAGVNTAFLKLFKDLDIGYQPPQTSKLLVREYRLGEEAVSKYIGPAFHAFLLDIPGLDYGAIIPKGEFATICLLSSHGNLEPEVMDAFIKTPSVKQVLPPGFSTTTPDCSCRPRINVMGCKQPYGDRIVFIGDSGISRLYKDGIGAAYRSAKIASSTAIFQGISADDFKKYYMPLGRSIESDNKIGKFLFRTISRINKLKLIRRAILRMVSSEQQGKTNAERGMSMIMWDMLTGGAHYSEVLLRVLHPSFWARFLWNITVSLFTPEESGIDPNPEKHSLTEIETPASPNLEYNSMNKAALGKMYQKGEIIVREGDIGDCMYVIQEGLVEVFVDSGGQEIRLNLLGKDEFFGEMAIFEQEIRTATVRALGPARILTVDHKNFLQRIHEDSSLAYRVMEAMSNRIRNLSEELARQNINNKS